MSREVSGILQKNVSFEPAAFHIQHDLLTRKYPIAGSTIQRRAETPFREDKYYSEAPLQTRMHEVLLTELEADILAGAR